MSWLAAVLEFLAGLLDPTAVSAPTYAGGEGIKTLWLSWEEMTYSGDTANGEWLPEWTCQISTAASP